MILREHFPQLNGLEGQAPGYGSLEPDSGQSQRRYFNQTEVNRGLPLPMLLEVLSEVV